MKKKIVLKGIVKIFSVDHDLINPSDGLGIHRFLMKKICSELFKKIFIVLFASIVNTSNHTKCVSLSNQKCEIQPTLINLHPKELSQELHYYPFAVKLDKCVGSCNALNDLSNKVCAPNKTGDLNIHVFNIIAEKSESKISAKDISCETKSRFDGKNVIQINGGIMMNVNMSVKNVVYVKKIFGILLHVVLKMENVRQVLWRIQRLRLMKL